MAMITVNNVAQSVGRRGTLDRIATGVDTAAKILGAGAQTYEAMNKAPLYKAQAEQMQADTSLKRAQTSIEFLKMGYMPIDDQHIGVPSNATSKDAQGIINVNGQHYAQVGNPTFMTEVQKEYLQSQLKDKVLTSDHDSSPDKTALYIPGFPYPVWAKQAELSKEQSYSTADGLAKAFNAPDTLGNKFQIIHSAAAVAARVASTDHLTRADDIALTTSLIKSLAPQARISGDGVEGVQEQITPQIQEGIHKLKALYAGVKGEGDIGGLDPETRANMVRTIQSVYDSNRPAYDQAYADYSNTSKSRGLPITITPLPQINWPTMSTSHGSPSVSHANAAPHQAPKLGGAPAPSVLDRTKSLFGIQ